MGKKKRSIKKDILAKILCSTGLRYTDARPRNIDNDLYNYHLQHLVKKGLVKKDGSRYSLTLAGKKYVEVVEPVDPKGQTADLFRLNVLAILLDRRKDRIKILSQIKKTSPYFGDKGVIGGAVKLGEFSTKAAARRFKEETGLNAKFNLIGVIRLVRMYPHNELFSDIIFNVCVATSHGGKLIQKSRFGTNQWIDIKTAIRNESESVQSSKELVKVLKLLRDKKPSDISFFYKEEVSKLKSI